MTLFVAARLVIIDYCCKISSMSIPDYMFSKLKYKGISVNMFGLPEFRDYKRNSISAALYRLKKRRYVTFTNSVWKLTKSGEKYFKRRSARLPIFDFSFKKESPRNLLVIFDIPEARKAEREWFRFHLKKFNYKMIQQSAWVGPSPLPQEFLDYLKNIKLRDCIKTFKLARSYPTG